MTQSVATLKELIEHIRSLGVREVVLATDIPEKNYAFEYITSQLHIPVSWQELPRDVDNFLYQTLHVNNLGGYGDALAD